MSWKQRLPAYTASLHSVSVCVSRGPTSHFDVAAWIHEKTLSLRGMSVTNWFSPCRCCGAGKKGMEEGEGKNGATCIRCATIMAEREGRGGSVVAWRKFNSNSQKRFAAKRNLPVETKLCISFLSFFFFFPSSAKRAERKSLLERDPFPWNAITRTHFDRITRQFLNFRKFDRLG